MPKPFDATTKRLLELDPAGWLACLGLPITGPVRAVDSDLSTVVAEADTVLQVGEPADYLAHIELRSAHDLALPRRLLHYNVLLHHRHARPVRSVAIILSRKADSPGLTGLHRVNLPEGPSYLDFRYTVLRLWTMDVETILQSGVGTLPLAPLAKVARKDLRGVIDRMRGRFEREVPDHEANLLWTATKILMGMRYSKDPVEILLQGVQRMKESVTYQAILDEGRDEGLIRGRVLGEVAILLRLGRKRLGEPSTEVVSRIEAMVDESSLARMADRLLEVSTWEGLLEGL